MNKVLKEKLCHLVSEFLNEISHKTRSGRQVLQVRDYFSPQKSYMLSAFFDIADIDYVFFGTWGECGMAVFLDGDMVEVFRVAFVDEETTRCWFIKN